ncbi:MAG: hypothetical protein AAFM92_07660 [Pseudomonadota bacterium]
MSEAPRSIGHNHGPAMDRGVRLRSYQWKKAREALLPTLPLVVLKMRVRRAKELGLDYSTYAGVRASTGRDVIGFLFSSNALDLKPAAVRVPDATAMKLDEIRAAGKLAMVHPPLDPKAVAQANPALDDVATAPLFTDTFPVTRDKLRRVIAAKRLPADGVLVIGSTTLERNWCATMRAAGYLSAERYFGDAR